MKNFKPFLFFALAVFLFSACQKELNFDDSSTGISVGTLKTDSLNECFPFSLNGQYITDSALNNDHFIDVNVNVITTGSYILRTDTINGYSFTGVGTLGTPGINTVRLYGSGTPVVAGTDQFTVRYDNSSCMLDVTVQPAGVDAEYTFSGAGGFCTGATPAGTYTAGTALNAGDSVQLGLQIIAAGNYSITTTEVNGVSFSANGSFIDTTPQSVTLSGQGIPLVPGTFNFPVLGNGSSCSFSVTFL